MLIKLIQKKGLNRSLLLFKEWFEKTHKKRGKVYSWKMFCHEWTEEHQLNEFRDFFFETAGDYISCKMLNKTSFKLLVNSKTFPGTYRSPSDAYRAYLLKTFKKQELELIQEEKINPQKLAEAKKRKEAIQKAKEERKKLEAEKKLEKINQYQASLEKRKSKENLGE